ncbi:MAG: glutaredoxin 3 [Oceanospirillaceae bacterium]|jgi:glutaredoxin 3|nr:glutaredoxin 3 [Oceanospirillaceae bacterium]
MNIEIYSSRWCGFCMRAKMLLDSKGVEYKEIDVDQDSALRAQMMQRSGRRTVPQIFIDEVHVGGCDDLFAAERSGKLDELLAKNSNENN